MIESFRQWLMVAALLPKRGEVAFRATQCPSCGTTGLDFLYVADVAERIGYLMAWCKSCRQGIRISRVKVPRGLDFATFDDVNEGRVYVPEFREVEAVE